MNYNPLVIANKIVGLKKRDGLNITIMELLKLQYIAHGYSLAILDKPLFKGEVQAWPYGPVIPEVYNAFRKQGVKISTPLPLEESLDKQELSQECNEILIQVLKNYKDKNAWELSALTHRENSPWTQTVEDYGFYSEIPNSLTKSYYQELIS